ncbi:MAG: hypothetical protein H0W68_05890 [Gemmatimonadaceae bacterium]|nr:hypothetical protein [Gemmatimonadaceae bacterium]
MSRFRGAVLALSALAFSAAAADAQGTVSVRRSSAKGETRRIITEQGYPAGQVGTYDPRYPATNPNDPRYDPRTNPRDPRYDPRLDPRVQNGSATGIYRSGRNDKAARKADKRREHELRKREKEQRKGWERSHRVRNDDDRDEDRDEDRDRERKHDRDHDGDHDRDKDHGRKWTGHGRKG